ncbi:DUF2946 family protein [Bordetella genomosp. 9]|uniref:DUF2946 domain-containing protein n=1 Tax=Bordetella genomosp. 9 TaxID=1416803 RepID=A0A1W6YZ06_9BORD|nr:DUF2946 family protein [Bordetella genomosp. 9]ARP85823.1 hypothetical protein CAL13_06085 [Bordetella genomosp. 9]
MLPAARTLRATARARVLMCLLLLAVSVRALIPAGYMPDPHALRQGQLRISLCTSMGAVPIGQLLRDLHHGHDHAGMDAAAQHEGGSAHLHGTHDQGPDQAAGAECPFWAVAHIALHLPPAVVSPLLASAADAATHIVPHAALPPMPPAGPPLGSRAPPLA